MPIRKLISLSAAFIFMCALILSGCEHGSVSVVYVRTPPPPPLVETVVVSPGPGYYWVQGYQSWNGARYVWVPGHYEHVPAGRHRWIPGHWAHNGRGYYWVDGHWR
ncbi:MAG: hypothetical protein ABSE92_05240 [Terriglobales bacterium]|jgi:hypothetical protein